LLTIFTLTQSESNTLLDLPPELRDRIWQMAVISDARIEVTSDLRFPALFATSRQTRPEVLGLFHCLNDFTFTIRDMDTTLMQAWRAVGLKQTQHKRGFQLSFSLAWQAVMV